MHDWRKRGFGWSIDYRPYEPTWDHPCRLRLLPNKAERQDFKLTVFADNLDDAVILMQKAVDRIDAGYLQEVSSE